MQNSSIILRPINKSDFSSLDQHFGATSVYKKPLKLWDQYLSEQQNKIRAVRVVTLNNQVIGFGTLKFDSAYPYFKSKNIPEINDVLIAPEFRNKGYARALIKSLEEIAKQKKYTKVGIAVGLYKDYGPAQRLYIKMDYIPDCNGITYNNEYVIPGSTYPVDDDLLLWMSKEL